MNVKVIKKFPDVSDPKFSFKEWNQHFLTHNVILNDFYSKIYYPTHWTPLSIKCAFGGTEFYVTDKIRYGVDDKSYLILNDGTLYESYIDSETKVESFTLNFKREFVDEVFHSLSNNDDILIDYPEIREKSPVNFFEKLYQYNSFIISHLYNLRSLIKSSSYDYNAINESLYLILEAMFSEQIHSFEEAVSLNAKRRSTKLELYKRLTFAKDYIYSNYYEKIELKDLAKISCLSPYHLLRKFKSQFGITPHQYLTMRRIEAAKKMLNNTNKSITEICLSVGFESLSSFGDLFKKYYSLSPEKYRLSAQPKKQF
ncbi:MAG: helix-turn-helix transcriptional regulator [Ignavibacteria bacterium]